MRAEAVSWGDWSAQNAAPIVDEDKWHVAVAPGEVKVVSLEQLDDLFRLSIVDAETKVWQNGMAEWQPLRVIADLDGAPAPEPESKRTHPKPPSPRSAPPPPRAQSVWPAPPPSVRPAPPPPRAQSVMPAPPPSVRPAPPQPRPQSVVPAAPPSVRPAPPQPRPQSVAPAPVFAQPLGLAATQPAFVAPITVQPIASVRQLVVSARPAVAQGGGGFGRFLIGLSLVAGFSISLYRNDVVHDAAQSMHQEALFTKLESALGGPAFGTLRAIEQDSTGRLGSSLNSDLNASLAADAPTSRQSAPAQPEAATALTQPGTGSEAAQRSVVSLESLKPEKAGAAQVGSKAQAKAAPAKPVKVEKRSPPSKSASQMTEHERLNAAIGQSMFATPSKAKASKASEYDPLNPKL